MLFRSDKLATSASIAVTKKLTYIGEGLAARNQTFYVALYSDKECTQRVSNVKALVFKNADASTVVFSENIKAGKTYYIAECTQDGTSQTIGALADGTVYEAVFGNGNESYVTLPLDTFMVATVTTSRSRKKKIATVEARSIRKSSIA